MGSEAQAVGRLGAWIGAEVFGHELGEALSGTVRVVLPREAEFLLSRPLELAAFGGVALPRRQVSLVSTRELVDLLRPARDRLKLAVLSACNSGAAEAASTLHTLGLDELAEQVQGVQAALRYLYERPEPHALARGHDALSHYLPATGRSGRDGAAHRMAAVLLRAAAARAVGGATIVHPEDLKQYGADLFPRTLDELVTTVEAVPGVDFGAAFEALVQDAAERQELFEQAVARPRHAAAVTREALAPWD